MAERKTAKKATTKKAAAKKPAKKPTNDDAAVSTEVSDEQTLDALEALGVAVEEARKNGLVVKAIATCNTSERGTTVRY